MLIASNCRQNYEADLLPFRFESTMRTERDFELPGLPIMRKGMRLLRQTIAANRFSIRAALKAIFSSDGVSLNMYSFCYCSNTLIM
jgi:hypothetical protein